jgi:hypothetical protein
MDTERERDIFVCVCVCGGSIPFLKLNMMPDP